MTNMTTTAAQGSKAQPAMKVTDKAKAIAAEHSPTALTVGDDKAEPSALLECAPVLLPEATAEDADPAQPNAKATDGKSDVIDEPSGPALEAAVDAAPAEAPKANNSAKPTKKTSKSTLVQKLLSRSRGATLAEMEEATGWQAHSVRAFLTGLRKKGLVLVREARKDGVSAYRITA